MRVFLPLVALAAMGCPDDTDPKTGETGEDTGEAPPPPLMYNIQASFLEAIPTNGIAPAPLPEGLCATLIDPTPVISGDEAIDLATGTLDAAGQVTFTDIVDKPTLGLIVTVDDCPDSTDDIIGLPTSTGVLNASFADAKDGDTVEVTTFGLDTAIFQGFTLAATAASQGTIDLSMGGFMMGYTLEGTTPVAGVTVTSNPAPETVFYLDPNSGGDPAMDGGPFAEIDAKTMMPVPNMATVAGSGVFLIPNAAIGNWSATDETGALEFADILFGGFPGQVTIIAFFGAPPAM
ncbi:MAG: hypothetical protein AAF602_25350 [Myxococcota bacterium]